METNSEPAKEICKECDGTGEILHKEPLHKFYNSMGECEKCNGTGYVEWIDNIIPKEKIKFKPFRSPGVYVNEVDLSTRIPTLMDNIIAATGIPKKYILSEYGTNVDSMLFNNIKIPDLKIDTVKIEVKPKVDMNKIKEDETETCPKCNGSGLNCEPIKDATADRSEKCLWCGGNGKVSWLDKIYKRPKESRRLKAKWTIEAEKDFKALHSIDIEDELMKSLSEDLEKSIEEEILKNK